MDILFLNYTFLEEKINKIDLDLKAENKTGYELFVLIINLISLIIFSFVFMFLWFRLIFISFKCSNLNGISCIFFPFSYFIFKFGTLIDKECSIAKVVDQIAL